MYLLHSIGEIHTTLQMPRAILKYLSSNSSLSVLFEHKRIITKNKRKKNKL